MLKCLLFGNYKKQYLFEKRDFLDKGSFFFLGIGLDELGFLEKKFFEKYKIFFWSTICFILRWALESAQAMSTLHY